MCSLIDKQLLLTAYAHLFIMEQQKGQQGSEALQVGMKKSDGKLRLQFLANTGDAAWNERNNKRHASVHAKLNDHEKKEASKPSTFLEFIANKKNLEVLLERFGKSDKEGLIEYYNKGGRQDIHEVIEKAKELAELEASQCAELAKLEHQTLDLKQKKEDLTKKIEKAKAEAAAQLKKCNYCTLDVELSAQACVVCEGEEFTLNNKGEAEKAKAELEKLEAQLVETEKDNQTLDRLKEKIRDLKKKIEKVKAEAEFEGWLETGDFEDVKKRWAGMEMPEPESNTSADVKKWYRNLASAAQKVILSKITQIVCDECTELNEANATKCACGEPL